MEKLIRRETILKYRCEIDEMVNDIRRWITESSNVPDKDLIKTRTEDVFFASDLAKSTEIYEMRIIISAVYDRVSDRYGLLKSLLEDPSVNEIMVNGPDMIFVEQNKRLIQKDDSFTSCEELEDIIRMFASDVHREINEANPIVDARLPSGYRVNGVLRTVALNGPILTIRKFREKEIEMEDLISYGSITLECADDLRALVKSGYNIFISGGTSSGKTTFLNALTASIDSRERVIIIEDSAELQITHLDNKVHLECRAANSVGKGEVSMERLIRTSLRMRPDRIIVGEVRGREVVDMVQAMNTGHDGSMSTGHGNSIKGMLNRLETMYITDSQVSVASVRNQIANAVDIFVHLRRDADGKRRVCEVAEMIGFDGNDYIISYMYRTDDKGSLVNTGSGLKDRERLLRAGYGDRMNDRS